MLHQNSVFHGVMKQVPWHRFEPIVAQARDGRSKYNIPIWSGQIGGGGFGRRRDCECGSS